MSMHWKMRWSILLKRITLVETEPALEQLLQHLCAPNQPQVLAFANAHALNCAADSVEFFETLNSAKVILRDGSGMAMLYRMLRIKPGLNLNGTDLIPKIIKRFNGEPIALFGTQEPYLSKAAVAIGAGIAPNSPLICKDGFQTADTYFLLAKEAKPKLIVLGMGMPKQEKVAAQLVALANPCLIVCGGAIIDFMGGKTSRAPNWMQRMGIEWIYRFAVEPKRLFLRYLIGNPVFLLRSADHAFRK
jgi:N-acetylglucosaminyldiphosphoundecaprenol N-acetyl-beta-D-mannosaminyltransferase